MSRKKYSAKEVVQMLLDSDDDDDASSDTSESSDCNEMSSDDDTVMSSDENESETRNSMDTVPSTVLSTPTVPTIGMMSDLDWRGNTATVPQLPTFSGEPGILFDTTDFTPLKFFMSFVNEDLIRHIVCQTNLYAAQYLRDNDHKQKKFFLKKTFSPTILHQKYQD
jgi:hypothetical protein